MSVASSKSFHTKPPHLSAFHMGLFTACFGVASALYLVPHFFPLHIGTAYIILSLLMTSLSLALWKRSSDGARLELIVSVVLCLYLFFLTPLTSNDSQRYLWDGAVFLNGFDPYLTAPNDRTVSGLRALWPTPEEHANYPTLYPPGALGLFGLCALAGPVYGLWVWKALITVAACVSLVLMHKLLSARGSLKAFSLFAFSPLLLFEAQAGAHLDIICVLGIIAALYAIEKDRLITAGIIIGCAASVKFLPAVIIGPFLFYLKPKQAMKLSISAALTWMSIYSLMFGLGYKPLGLLPVFFEKWRGGAPLYPILENLNLAHAQFLLLLGTLAVIGFSYSAWLAKTGRIDIALMLSLAIPLLLSPILFPWYLLALLPIFALKPNVTVFTAITLAPLSYIVLNKWLSAGVWSPAIWTSSILLLGILLALFYDIRNADI